MKRLTLDEQAELGLITRLSGPGKILVGDFPLKINGLHLGEGESDPEKAAEILRENEAAIFTTPSKRIWL